jgi:hypothetical protein
MKQLYKNTYNLTLRAIPICAKVNMATKRNFDLHPSNLTSLESVLHTDKVKPLLSLTYVEIKVYRGVAQNSVNLLIKSTIQYILSTFINVMNVYDNYVIDAMTTTISRVGDVNRRKYCLTCANTTVCL